MPELPEVETMCRGLRPLIGATVRGARMLSGRYRPLSITPPWNTIARQVRGTRLERVERLGKRVLLPFSTGRTLVVEPRMTGLLLLADPPDRAALRWRLSFEPPPSSDPERIELAYWDRRGLGVMRWLTEAELREERRRVGPDALEVTPSALQTRCAARRCTIKVALLDQTLIAGIGNIYAAEILHAARISPLRPCHRLSWRHWRRLHEAMQRILNEAIRYEGSTLSDGTYRNAVSRPGRYQSRHRVYGLDGRRCRTCRRGWIRRVVQQQRSTFYCPVCQR